MDFWNDKLKRNIVVFSVLYILVNGLCIANDFLWLNLLPLALLFIYLLLFHFDKYILVLIALLPISVPLHQLVKGSSVDISLPAEILVVITAGYFVLKTFYDGRFDKRILFHPITIAIFFNLSWIFITSFTSTIPLVSFKFLASRIWFVLVFYFVFILFFTRIKNFIQYIWLFSLSFGIVILYSIVRLYTLGIGNMMRTANWVVEPFFPDHTSYAAAIAMIIPVMIAILLIRRKANIFYKSFIFGMIVFFIIGLTLSYTRAAWVSLLAATGFCVALVLKIRLRTTLLLLVGVIIILFTSWTQIQMSLSRNNQDSSSDLLKHVQSISNVSTDASNLERVNRWHCALKMFSENPVFGFGPGTFAFKYAPFQASGDKTIISTNFGNLGNAHSEYLGPLAESGFLGTVSFLAIVLTTMFTASRIYFTSKRRKVRILALALLIGLLSYNIHGIMNNFLDLDKLNALFWGFTAMVAALDIYHNKVEDKRGLLSY